MKMLDMSEQCVGDMSRAEQTIHTETPYDVSTATSSDHVEYNTSISQMKPDPSQDSNTIFCTGCGTRILDRYFLLVAGQHWHLPCLRCIDCNVQLDTQLTCFARDGNIFCKLDYFRRYSQRRCSRCHLGLSSRELVMRARDLIFHINCFTCTSCNKPLNTGDTFCLQGDKILCQDDYELFLNNYHGDMFHRGGPDMTSSIIDFYNGLGAIQKSRPRKRKHFMHHDDCLQTLGMLTTERGELIPRDPLNPAHPPRQKRVRTSFKHHQLRTMKLYFGHNHNPDAKDLKQLSQKTQLSKRVLQVWFQNARAKYRRSQAKQDGDTSDSGVKAIGTEDSEQLLDLSKCTSPALSDVSSGQSLAESMDVSSNTNGHLSAGEEFTELFSDGNNSDLDSAQ